MTEEELAAVKGRSWEEYVYIPPLLPIPPTYLPISFPHSLLPLTPISKSRNTKLPRCLTGSDSWFPLSSTSLWDSPIPKHTEKEQEDRMLTQRTVSTIKNSPKVSCAWQTHCVVAVAWLRG